LAPPLKNNTWKETFHEATLGSNPSVSRPIQYTSRNNSTRREADNFDAHDSDDELSKTVERLADLSAKDITTVVQLWVSIRDLDTRQPHMAPLVMKLRKQISLAEFWAALKAQHVKAMQEANLTAASPCSYTFKCVPEAKSANGSDPEKFRRHCLASRTREADLAFGELLNICLREGKPRAEKLLREVREKVNFVRIARTKAPRYDTAGVKRRAPKVEVPTGVHVWASVKIFLERS